MHPVSLGYICGCVAGCGERGGTNAYSKAKLTGPDPLLDRESICADTGSTVCRVPIEHLAAVHVNPALSRDPRERHYYSAFAQRNRSSICRVALRCTVSICQYYDVQYTSLRTAMYRLATTNAPGFLWEDVFVGGSVRRRHASCDAWRPPALPSRTRIRVRVPYTASCWSTSLWVGASW